MNIIFMRHGEAIDNVRGILSCREEQCSTLTNDGIAQVASSIKNIERVDKIYTSPLIRTLQTAREVSLASGAHISVDDRIREIDWGRFAGCVNNSVLDSTRRLQADGDFFVRFGQYGENRFEIEQRLCNFLGDICRNNFNSNTILIVSHGTVISFMKRILGLTSSHAKKGKLERFYDVDFSELRRYGDYLDSIKGRAIKKRLGMIPRINNKKLCNGYCEIAKDFTNIEFPNSTLSNLAGGLEDELTPPVCRSVSDGGGVLICLFKNFEPFLFRWIDHYVHIGIRNFVLLDNKSTDNSAALIDNMKERLDINIDVWRVEVDYSCFRSCGWRQQVMEYYGSSRWYLNVDSDELFMFSDDTNESIEAYVKKLNKKIPVKALMLDVYSKHSIFASCSLREFKYFDKCGYVKEYNKNYTERIFGGPRRRVFGLSSSLQKTPLVYYTGEEIIANDHYLYPWSLNASRVSTVLLHFKFLPETLCEYEDMANSGVHWNESKEYKTYVDYYKKDNTLSLYSSVHSDLLDNLKLGDLLK